MRFFDVEAGLDGKEAAVGEGEDDFAGAMLLTAVLNGTHEPGIGLLFLVKAEEHLNRCVVGFRISAELGNGLLACT